MKTRIYFSHILFLFFFLAGNSFSDDRMENFLLLDHRGVAHELYRYSDKKAIVLIWQGNGCPIVRQYYSKIKKLKEKYADQDVQFFYVNAVMGVNRQEIIKEITDFQATEIPVLLDDAQLVSMGLNIERTAEAVVIDPKKWKVKYQGPIDDAIDYESQKKATQHYLKNAIQSVIKGRRVKIKKQRVKGCLIFYENTKKEIDYVEDVAPILKKNCMICHVSNGVAPWTMNNYKTLKRWGPMMKEVIRTKRMPPAQLDPVYGSFNNDYDLSSEELNLLIRWIDEGMVYGEGEDPLLNVPSIDVHSWKYETPDYIMELPVQEIQASGDQPYIFLVQDINIETDKWIKYIEFHTEHPQILHHALVYKTSPGKDQGASYVTLHNSEHAPAFIEGRRGENIIGGFSKGSARFEPINGVGVYLKKGQKILVELHYQPIGVKDVDHPRLGFTFYDEAPEHEALFDVVMDFEFQIPPYTEEYYRQKEKIFENDSYLCFLTPHMHKRGKWMRFVVEFPDGSKEIILSSPHYNFNWSHPYFLDEPKFIPKGSKLIVEGAFDNSERNPFNPNPSQSVFWGPYLHDEMFSGFVGYYEK